MEKTPERQLAVAWLILMGLTTVSVLAAHGGHSFEGRGGAAVPILMATAFVKARQVLDHFLELRKAGAGWRNFFMLMLGGLFLVLTGLGLLAAFFQKTP